MHTHFFLWKIPILGIEVTTWKCLRVIFLLANPIFSCDKSICAESPLGNFQTSTRSFPWIFTTYLRAILGITNYFLVRFLYPIYPTEAPTMTPDQEVLNNLTHMELGHPYPPFEHGRFRGSSFASIFNLPNPWNSVLGLWRNEESSYTRNAIIIKANGFYSGRLSLR